MVLVGTDRLHGVPGEFRVVRCRDCGLARTNPRPDPASMCQYYPEDYEPFKYTRSVVPHKGTERSLWRRVAKALLDVHSMHVPNLVPGTMLEVGCAGGAYLEYMRSRRWVVEGLEPNAQAAEFARSRGLDVRTGSLAGGATLGGMYDLIVAWMVIEHLHDPLGGLQLLRARARPGAYLCFSVPNIDSLEFRLFRERWFALSLPTHLFHFSPDTITKLLRHAGWSVERIFPHRALTTVAASAAYVLEDAGLHAPALFLRKNSNTFSFVYGTAPLAHAAAAMGATGAMTVWARA